MGRVIVLSALIAGLVVASLVAGFLAWQLKIETDLTRELKAQLARKDTRESFELQQRCADLAEKYLKAMRKEDAETSFDYQSHYNSNLNKCLLATHEFKNPILTKMLFDVNEGRLFAYYLWMSEKGKQYWEVPPAQCELTPSNQNKRDCSSQEEYDRFVASYME